MKRGERGKSRILPPLPLFPLSSSFLLLILVSQESFEEFRRLVLEDTALQRRLLEEVERESFVRLVVREGAERGFRFTAGEVEAAMREGRRAWLERWV